jgi:hypothetical protein
MHRTHVANGKFAALFFAHCSKIQKHEQRVKNNKTIQVFILYQWLRVSLLADAKPLSLEGREVGERVLVKYSHI